MCGWLSSVKLEDPGSWTVLDLFCGQARLSRLAAKLGFRTASIDVGMPGAQPRPKMRRRFRGPKRNLFDINGHCGLPLPSCILGSFLLLTP